MSYISIALSPYRGNLEEEIGEILYEDHKRVCETIPEKGFIFVVAYITIMALSVLKMLYHIFDHYRKPKRPIPKITRDIICAGINLSPVYEIKEARGQNKPHYTTKNQIARVQATMKLRTYLYNNNLKLTGYIIKKVNHKVSEHAFINSIINGEDIAKFSTTYITFGEDVDKYLAEILSSKPKIRKVEGVQCLAFENDYGFMVEELKQIYQEPIKVTFDSL